MKKSALQKKWKKISNEPGWISESDPTVIQKIKARNTQMRAQKEKKEAKFTANIAAADLEAFKSVAAAEGMGYQTLLGSLIHKYVSGRLVDIAEVQKVMIVPVVPKKKKMA